MENPEAIFDHQQWWLKSPKQSEWRKFEFSEGRKHGKDLVATLKDCETRDAAAILTGFEIGLSRSLLPVLPENAFYWSDLEGLTALDPKGEEIGHIAYLYEAGASDIMVLQAPKEGGLKERHIPFVMGDVVLSVDLEKANIVIDWDF
jgi:16S rRNA processing protein RimM